MKKLLLLCLAAFFSTASFAQVWEESDFIPLPPDAWSITKYGHESSVDLYTGTRYAGVHRRYDKLGRISYLRADLQDGISSEEIYSYTLIGQERSRTGTDFQELLDYTPAGLIASAVYSHGGESSHEVFNYDGMGRLTDRGAHR